MWLCQTRYPEECHVTQGGADPDTGKASMELTLHSTKMISLVPDTVTTMEKRVKRRIGIFLAHFPSKKYWKMLKNRKKKRWTISEDCKQGRVSETFSLGIVLLFYFSFSFAPTKTKKNTKQEMRKRKNDRFPLFFPRVMKGCLFLIFFFSWTIFILALVELAILREWGTGQATRRALTFHSTASG